MTIHVEGKSMNLVQVINNSTGESMGLYFVPYDVNIDEIEYAIENAKSQDDFDKLDIQRVFPYEILVELKF